MTSDEISMLAQALAPAVAALVIAEMRSEGLTPPPVNGRSEFSSVSLAEQVRIKEIARQELAKPAREPKRRGAKKAG